MKIRVYLGYLSSVIYPRLFTLGYLPSVIYPRLFTLGYLPSVIYPRLFTLGYLSSVIYPQHHYVLAYLPILSISAEINIYANNLDDVYIISSLDVSSPHLMICHLLT